MSEQQCPQMILVAKSVQQLCELVEIQFNPAVADMNNAIR